MQEKTCLHKILLNLKNTGELENIYFVDFVIQNIKKLSCVLQESFFINSHYGVVAIIKKLSCVLPESFLQDKH